MSSFQVLWPQVDASATAVRTSQRGATLIVGMIVLVVITLIVINAFVLSSTNLQAVNNMQAREEAIAAANQAIELLVSTSFTSALGAQTLNVDIDKDGNNDYQVQIAAPVCARATLSGVPPPSDVELPALAGAGSWATDWDIVATATNVRSGVSATVQQGIRVSLSDVQKAAACP